MNRPLLMGTYKEVQARYNVTTEENVIHKNNKLIIV